MIKEIILEDGREGYECVCGIGISKLEAYSIVDCNGKIVHYGHKACLEAKLKELNKNN